MTTQKRRRIKRGKITHVSLCRRAMNKLPILMKSGDRVQIELLTKVQPEGLVHALVYVPEENGAVDFEGDTAPAAVIKQMAHDFLANGGNVDVEHNLQPLSTEQVRIAETFIVQKGDERFQSWQDYSGNPVDSEGSWAMILKVLDPELRAAFESGELNGVSMFGHAEVEVLTKTNTTNTKKKMDEAQMQAFCEMLTKSLSAALKPATPEPKPEPPRPEPVEFEGDPMDSADLKKHMDKVLLASLDLTKPADLAKWQGHVAKRQAEIAKAEADAATPEAKLEAAQAELKKAQDKLAKIQKSSNVADGADPEAGDDKVSNVGLKKAEASQFAAGKKAMRAFQGVDDK